MYLYAILAMVVTKKNQNKANMDMCKSDYVNFTVCLFFLFFFFQIPYSPRGYLGLLH